MIYKALFKTKWGWFGLLWSARGLRRACLPMHDRQAADASLLDGLQTVPQTDAPPWNSEQRIQTYFEGMRVDFLDLPVDVPDWPPFHIAILHALRSIPYGQTVSYTELAALAHRPRAVRAAANAVAQNPLPLIIPCHRVVRKDGSLGGFSAAGGVDVKKRLIDLENERVPQSEP